MKNSLLKSMIIVIISLLFIMSCSKEKTTVSSQDIEDNEPIKTKLDSIVMGTQVWTAKNLDIDHYRNGDTIRHCKTNTEWMEAGDKHQGAWCYYNNDTTKGKIYGKLYNWYAVNDSRGLAPKGWHVPSDEEWKTLEMYVGMSRTDADKVNYRGTDEGAKLAGRVDLWSDGVLSNNENFGTSEFSGLPAGYRRKTGEFSRISYNSIWWSSSEYIEGKNIWIWYRDLHYNFSNIGRYAYDKHLGYSVRLIRD